MLARRNSMAEDLMVSNLPSRSKPPIVLICSAAEHYSVHNQQDHRCETQTHLRCPTKLCRVIRFTGVQS